MKECPKCESCFSDDLDACPNDASQLKLALPGPRLLASRYLLERRLGRGAMGQVYLAMDKKFAARCVAVKTVRQDILSSDDLQEGEAIARFEREAQAAATIQHPNTVSVTDFGETPEGVFFLVMEYVEGETLHRLLRREGTLPVKRAVRLLRQIADGVEAAHELGILHRDLKPANIFIMQRGRGDGFIKVGDFGLAKIVNRAMTDLSSGAGPASRGIIGTPEFMSPEQMQPDAGVDARADLYALGTIAYLMLAGRTPFTGDLMQLVMQKVMQKPAPLSNIRTDVPRAVERVIMHALEIDPADRPSTVGAWIEELESAAEDIGESIHRGRSRLVVLAPLDAEVYIDDERKGSIGNSGRIVLSDVPVGRHVLRVSKAGERDDERVIEIREGSDEQVIQAQLRPRHSTGSSHPSQGGSGQPSSVVPGIVACANCGARFAEGVRFCGRCGGRAFTMVSRGATSGPYAGAVQNVGSFPCPRCAAVLPGSSKFCGRCGLNITGPPDAPRWAEAPLRAASSGGDVPRQAERVCQRCGGTYAAHIRFCGRCGGAL
ncbi:MAG: protein kinase domain-containing protein [Pyrinomonadaceae bacterium]